MCKRLLDFPLRSQRRRQGVVGRSIVRVKVNGCRQIQGGPLRISAVEHRLSEVAVHIHKVVLLIEPCWRALQSLRQMPDGLVKSSLMQQGHSKVIMYAGVVGFNSHSAVVMLHTLLMHSFCVVQQE